MAVVDEFDAFLEDVWTPPSKPQPCVDTKKRGPTPGVLVSFQAWEWACPSIVIGLSPVTMRYSCRLPNLVEIPLCVLEALLPHRALFSLSTDAIASDFPGAACFLRMLKTETLARFRESCGHRHQVCGATSVG